MNEPYFFIKITVMILLSLVVCMVYLYVVYLIVVVPLLIVGGIIEALWKKLKKAWKGKK